MEFLIQHFGIILTSIFGGTSLLSLLGWFFEKKKNKAIVKGVEADVDEKEITNSDKIVERYVKALDDLEGRYEKKFIELSKDSDLRLKTLEDACDRKVKIVNEELKLKNRFILSLKREVSELKRQLKDAESNRTK